MNLELFEKLWAQGRPSQHSGEWRMFLELCESYLEKHKIRNPIVVELGLFANTQKKFYEQFFGSEHIGIDTGRKRCVPDIQGNTHDPMTLEILKEKLAGRPVNILYIDASHTYESVKKDFEMYSPLCTDIIALHDINLGRGKTKETRQVWRFWDELKITECKNFSFTSIEREMGTGVMVRK